MQLFYDPVLTPDSRECVFGKEESNHILRVLRKKVGDTVRVTNGKGFVFTG
ncbi:MAG: RNA methyltransferase PUA domain-containing protein, partial [Flavobacteriaceae bacterium]